jgi:hypothetical protein
MTDLNGVKVFQKKKRPYNRALVPVVLEKAKDWQERKNYLPDGHGEPGPVTSGNCIHCNKYDKHGIHRIDTGISLNQCFPT